MKTAVANRIEQAYHPLTKKLFRIIEEKETRVAFNPDVTDKSRFLELVDAVGPSICVLKTHVDIIEDFDKDFVKKLLKLAAKHNFLIFEDRKFIDIGSVVREQYRGGVYHIADWADIVNAVPTMPGEGVIEGLAEVGVPRGRGLLVLTEMSSRGALRSSEATERVVEMARRHPEFVIGFISQQRCCDDPGFVYMTPGVQLEEGGDALGQRYRTPHRALVEQGNDVIIVGRGIYAAPDPAAAAEKYRQAALLSP